MNRTDSQYRRGINERVERTETRPAVSPRTPQHPGVADAGRQRRSDRPHLRASSPRVWTPIVTAFAFAVLTVVTTVAPEQAFAQSRVLISNIDESGSSSLVFESSGTDAQRFQTGADALGYTMTSIEIRTNYTSADAVSSLPTLKLKSGSASGTEVAALTKPSSGSNILEYTVSTAVSLDANTTYWIVATNATFGKEWHYHNSDSTDSDSLDDWRINGLAEFRATSSAPFTSWPGIYYVIRVNGTAPNSAPTVANELLDQTATAGTAFSYAFPANTFSDTADTLTYTATKADDTALPTWLSFDAATRTFSGTPTSADIGTLSIRVTATNSTNQSVSDTFSIVVEANIAGQTGRVAEAFSYTVAANIFADASTTGTLTYTARLTNGRALASNTHLGHGRVKPGWLRFNGSTRTFSGTPLPGSDGTLLVRVTATDARGARFSATFDLSVGVDSGLVGNFTRPGTTGRHLVWFDHAQKFTTGADTAGYTVTSIDVLLRDVHSNSNFPTVTIASGATPPGSDVATLQTPTSGASGGDKPYRYTAPANLALSANTSYWIVITGGSSSIVRMTGWTIIDAGSSAGWSIESKTYRNNIRHNQGYSQGPNSSATSLRINGMTTGNQQAVDPPTVTRTPAISSAGEDGRWGPDETVEVTLTFNEAVEVDTTGGTPDIGIALDLTEARRAAYESGSGTDTLVLAYTLDKDDGNRSSMAVTPNSLTLNGGGIRSVATSVDAVLDHNGTVVQGSAGRTPTGPTASFSGLPGNHGGNPFTFGLGFSAEPEGLSYRTVRGGLLNVEGGTVTKAVRSTRGSNQGWRVTVAPSGSDDVRIELPNRACGEANALCISGQPLAAAVSATIAHHEEAVALPPLTGSFSGAPTEHNGGEAFELKFRLSEEPRGISFRTVQNGLFTVSGGSITRAWRITAGENREWGLKVTPSGFGAVKLVVNATTDCGQAPGVCTDDGRMLAGGTTTTIEGPPTLSVADAEVDEGPNAGLEFTVTLNRRVEEEVTVGYRTENGTATAGLDYTETTGTLSLSAGDTSGTVSVPVRDDAHDEGSENMTLRLHSPSPARVKLADATATGTINNHDPMPKAWMVRFGRTVGSQVVDALGERLEGGSGSHVTVAGINVVGAAPLEPEAEEDDPFALPAWAAEAGLEGETNEINTDDILLRSAFHLSSTREGGGTGPAFTAWGRVATGGFETEEDGVTMDGDVTTGLVGFDAEWERALAGVMFSQSEGEGSYRLEPDDIDHAHSPDSGTVESSLTGVYPYARLHLNARVSAWALAGVGSGELTLRQEGAEPMATDISMRMVAVGVKGQVLDGTGPSKVAMNVKSDAMWVGTKSEDTDELAPTEGDVTRLRLILEGNRAFELGNGATFTPSAEVGLRHDGGDAETGTGVEVGVGLRYTAGAVTIEAQARTLVAHEASGYEEWGASGAIRVTPSASGQGLTLSIAPQWGRTGSASGQLWSARDAAELERDSEFEPTGRLAIDAGYGFGLGPSRGVLTPYAGATLGDGKSRTLRTGARWQLNPDAVLGLEATRQTSDAAEAENEVRLRATIRF